MLQWILYWRREQKQLQAQMRHLHYQKKQRGTTGYKSRWMATGKSW